MALKAFVVSDPESALGNLCELVFAENAGKARYLALKRSVWFSQSDLRLSDLKVKREPKADTYTHITKNQPGVVWFDDSHYELFRNVLGWHEIDEDTCDTCGLSAYGQPQYVICGDCNQCGECGHDCWPEGVRG